MGYKEQDHEDDSIKRISADTDMPWLKWPMILLLTIVSVSGLWLAVFSIVIHWDDARLYIGEKIPLSAPIFEKLSVGIRKERLPVLTELHLTGIMGDLKNDGFRNAVAILNGQSVPVGAETNGIRIVKAEMKSIVIEFEEKEYMLEVGKTIILAKPVDAE